MRRLFAFVLGSLLLNVACATVRPTPPPPVDRTAEYTVLCETIWRTELGRAIDPTGLDTCLRMVRQGETADQVIAWMRQQPEWIARQGWESGWLSLNANNSIVTDQGIKWRGIGSTDFLLFQRYAKGEDIMPVLLQRRELGVNYLRVLGMFDGGLGRFRLEETPDYLTQLESFLTLVASVSLRVEFVVFADAQRAMPDLARQHAHLAKVTLVLNKHWNVLGELVNEPAQNGIDPSRFSKPSGPTLWSKGSNCCGFDGYFPPPWDYITHHPARDDQWPRKAECRPIRDHSGHDCLEDEPIGASATNQPGRRSNNVVDFGQAGALYGLVTSGGLFHSDSGIAAQPFNTAELNLARAFIKGLTFAPVAAITAPYQRGDNCGNCDGIGGMPLEQLDSKELRTFCKTVDGKAYCVIVRGTRAPRPRAGWRITSEPLPGVLILER